MDSYSFLQTFNSKINCAVDTSDHYFLDKIMFLLIRGVQAYLNKK